ncbi:hypothetical protein JM93_01373 [Roseibium hamelinense]|uniref:Uncharacterized protein n=1 Tax=Roseibium hamelinense TaxID=150831 RepID=A0A562T9X1_9HYPH|nr:hypothetical protein [Roseibium hamelinense]MTI45244.1 hypothetical protein [Roseibium hamelinense]TWI90392.1 hypothetical protein JM93_01373 [Roseibium hamelinense]
MIKSAGPVLSTVTQDFKASFQRLKRNVVLLAAALLCLFTAYLAAVAGVWALLSMYMGPVWAAAAIFALMLVFSGLLIARVQYLTERDRKRREKQKAAQRLGLAAAFSILPELSRSKNTWALIAFGGLVYLLARSRDGNDDA